MEKCDMKQIYLSSIPMGWKTLKIIIGKSIEYFENDDRGQS